MPAARRRIQSLRVLQRTVGGLKGDGEGNFPACAVASNDDGDASLPVWTWRSSPPVVFLVGFGQPCHAGNVERHSYNRNPPTGAERDTGGGGLAASRRNPCVRAGSTPQPARVRRAQAVRRCGVEPPTPLGVCPAREAWIAQVRGVIEFDIRDADGPSPVRERLWRMSLRIGMGAVSSVMRRSFTERARPVRGKAADKDGAPRSEVFPGQKKSLASWARLFSFFSISSVYQAGS